MCSTPNSTPLSLVFRIISYKNYEFAIEPFVGPYVLVTLCGSDLPSKQARNTKPAIKAAIIALYEDLQPTPTAPAAVLVFPAVRVHAIAPRSDHKMNISKLTKAQREMLELLAAGYLIRVHNTSYRWWNPATREYDETRKVVGLTMKAARNNRWITETSTPYPDHASPFVTWYQISDAGREALTTPPAPQTPAATEPTERESVQRQNAALNNWMNKALGGEPVKKQRKPRKQKTDPNQAVKDKLRSKMGWKPKTSPASSPTTERRISIPTQTVGEYYRGIILISAIVKFEAKYGVRPNLIKVNPDDWSFAAHGMRYQYIPVQYEDTLGDDCHYHLSYTPAVKS